MFVAVAESGFVDGSSGGAKVQGGDGTVLAELGLDEEDCKPRMAVLVFAMTLDIAMKVWFTAFSKPQSFADDIDRWFVAREKV